MRRLALPALVLIVSAALVAGCGAGASLDAVARAADTSVKQQSEHMEMVVTVRTGAQTISMNVSGDFSNSPLLGDLTLTATAAGQPFSMHEVMKGTTIYVSSSLFQSRLPGGKTWVALDMAKAGKALGVDLGGLSSQSPVDALQRLRASGTVQKVGTATIDGVSTTHYTATIDPAKLAKIEAKLPASLRQQLTYRPADVWIDGQGLVRRIHMSFAQGSPTSSGAETELTMTFSHYGEDVHVSLPLASQTFDATSLATSALGNGGTP